MDKNLVATQTIFVRLKNGPPVQVGISVYKPERDPKSEAKASTMRCLVEFDGIGRSDYSYGETSLQALSLAFVYLRSEIESLVRDGYEFYWSEKDDEAFPLIFALFSGQVSTPWPSPPEDV